MRTKEQKSNSVELTTDNSRCPTGTVQCPPLLYRHFHSGLIRAWCGKMDLYGLSKAGGCYQSLFPAGIKRQ